MKKIIKTILLIILLVYIALQIIPYNTNSTSNNYFTIQKGQRPLMIAHGGAKAMNPENTWMAYDFAYESNADVLEMYLHITKDGVLVTIHNDDIESYTNQSGRVEDFTLQELQNMNFGYHFTDLDGNQPYHNLDDEALKNYNLSLTPAVLEDMFIKYNKDVLYIIEIKNEGTLGYKAADELIRLVNKYNMEKYVCLASFNQDVMNYINTIKHKDTLTSFDFDTATDFVIANYAGYGYFTKYTFSGFQLPMEEKSIPLASKYLIYKIHHNNMFVHYWTINTKEEMIKCIENGADGIITDRLDLLNEVYEELGFYTYK